MTLIHVAEEVRDQDWPIKDFFEEVRYIVRVNGRDEQHVVRQHMACLHNGDDLAVVEAVYLLVEYGFVDIWIKGVAGLCIDLLYVFGLQDRLDLAFYQLDAAQPRIFLDRIRDSVKGPLEVIEDREQSCQQRGIGCTPPLSLLCGGAFAEIGK